MKYLSRILVFAFAIISAAACYNNEIEDPENPQAPERSGLRITATMAKTRVSYGNPSSDSDYLLPVWEKGDILFGFYVESDEIKNFILKVTDVDGSYGATLGFVAGKENGLADQPVETPVYLIYTGKNGVSSIEDTDIFSEDGVFSVDLTTQNLERVPVCMSATASIGGTAEAKTLSFDFDYDCAILEINSLTGFSEEGFTSGALSSIEVTNVIQKGTYSLNENALTFAKADDASAATYEIDFTNSAVTGDKTWSIDENGVIVNNDGMEGVLIAVVPNETKSKLTVTGKTTVGADSHDFSFDYGSYRLEKGNCYVIGAKDVVAKTADGKYFKTVTAAFAHADTLYQDSKANTVTLLRNCGLAGIDATGVPVVGASAPIDIDGYNVTLDLNGKTLSLDGEECFQVEYDSEEEKSTENPSTFTIQDSGVGGGIESAADYMVKSFGTVNINSGFFTSTESWGMVLNGETGVLTIKGGTLQSFDSCVVENHGTLNVEGGNISSTENFTIDSTYGTGVVNISGGIIHCDDVDAISIADELYITGGTIESNFMAISGYSAAIYISGDCNIKSNNSHAISLDECTLIMSGGKITGALVGIILSGGSTGKITGGYIESTGEKDDEDGYALYVKNSTCTISGGTFKNSSKTKPAIFCFTKSKVADLDEGSPNLLITWPEGGESAGGPLIVSSAEKTLDGKSFGAVSTANPIDEKTHEEMTNHAIVEISGGYLYSSDDAFCSKAGKSSLLFKDPFYTNRGVLHSDSICSSYYDFSIGSYVFVPSEHVSTVICGGKEFAFKISPEWTYVIDNCSQTKTEIGANEEVTYSFRSYKQRGTEKVAVPWKAQMFVSSNAGNGWRDNHDYGNDGEQLHWTTNIDDAGDGSADSGLGSTDDPEEYKITFMSTASDTYKVRIIASDDDGSITYEFDPVVQTISSTPSTDPTVTELWHGSTTRVTIYKDEFKNKEPQVDCIIRVYAELNQQDNPITSCSVILADVNYSTLKEGQSFTAAGYTDFVIDNTTLLDYMKNNDFMFVTYYGCNITKVELIQ